MPDFEDVTPFTFLSLKTAARRISTSCAVLAILGFVVNFLPVRGQASSNLPAPAKDAGRVKLTDEQIETEMKVLTGWTSRFGIYEFYLLNIPIDTADILLSRYQALPWYNIDAV